MPSVYPVIPESIVVHLGAPTAYAENVTVAFPDYIKNVVCSEIYPTWEESAIVANTLANGCSAAPDCWLSEKSGVSTRIGSVIPS